VHDIVIRGGRIADGSGSALRTGDVAIDGEHISAVGTVEDSGRREIDADGLLVTPGWVDVHTHYDGQVTWDPEVSPSGWHGVTTVVVGNCGVGFAPVRSEERDWVIQLMEGVEDIPGTALAEGMTWNWQSFPEYLDEVERVRRVMDVAAMVPHGALRAFVLGCDRNNAEAGGEELSLMAKLTAEAIDAGAVGFSTTRTLAHMAKDGQPAAGTFAAPEEMLAIGQALAGKGRRVFSVVTDHLLGSKGEEEFRWMAEVSRRSRIPVTYMVIDVPFTPGGWRTAFDRGLEHNRDGAWLVPQVAGKPASLMVGWESTYHLFSGHEHYQPLAGLPLGERVARLRDAGVRRAILEEPLSFTNAFVAILHSQLVNGNLFQLGDPPDYEPRRDRSIAALAATRGVPPHELAYDLMLEQGGRELLYTPLLGYTAGDMEALRTLLAHPSSVLGLGDGGAHVGFICDGSLPSFMLAHWARDRSRGETLPLEHVVHLQTERPARLFGFADRGRLAPGYLADVNVVDFDRLSLGPVQFAYDLPAGGKRLVQRASGYLATLKGGAVVREHDEFTGERPGVLLRGPQPAPPGAAPA
jgi:N-acyl-D-aspartate/D-glutamate deacylase